MMLGLNLESLPLSRSPVTLSSPVESERDHSDEEHDEDHGGPDDDGEADHDGGPRGPRPGPGLLPHRRHEDPVTVPRDNQAVRLDTEK